MTRRRKPAALTHAADHYQAALDAVMASLGGKPDDELVKHVTFLRLVRDNMTAAAMRGERVVVADVLALDQALKAHLPAKQEEVRFEIDWCETAVGIGHVVCPECGYRATHRFEAGTLEPLPPKPAPVEVPVTEAAPTPAPPADNVVPLGRNLHYGSDIDGAGGNRFMGGFGPSRGSGVAGVAFGDLNPNRKQ
jgi:hypothetical protein